jgi:hypothetical protein
MMFCSMLNYGVYDIQHRFWDGAYVKMALLYIDGMQVGSEGWRL